VPVLISLTGGTPSILCVSRLFRLDGLLPAYLDVGQELKGVAKQARPKR
jgi:hypothetical protein